MGRRIIDEESLISETKAEFDQYYEPKYIKPSKLERTKTTTLYLASTFAIITFIYLSVDLFHTIQFFTEGSTPEELQAIIDPNYKTPSDIKGTPLNYHPNIPESVGYPTDVESNTEKERQDAPMRYVDDNDYPHLRKNDIKENEPVEKDDITSVKRGVSLI